MLARFAFALIAALLAVGVGADDPPPFDKDALEAILKKEHSQKVSNVYDSENSIQCVQQLLFP